MKDKAAVIIIDTGFSLEALAAASASGKILAVLNVANGKVVVGEPFITMARNEAVLRDFAYDPLNHGSLVLKNFLSRAPDIPVILVRAYDDEVVLARTVFANGKMARPGWTEAYLVAVKLCSKLGLASVASLSFGGYTHAMDGTGWESHCLAQCAGAGKPGHVVVAGAGAGDGRAIHASLHVEPACSEEVTAFQSGDASYNFWCRADAASPEASDWLLEVFLNGRHVVSQVSSNLAPNLWNNRKQVNFRVRGSGQVKLRVTRFWRSDTETSAAPRSLSGRMSGLVSASSLSRQGAGEQSQSIAHRRSFDCWIDHRDNAGFLDHVDAMTIAEPAIFPHVIAVGLASHSYAPNQCDPEAKPEILMSGNGPISFRLPEVAAQAARLLSTDPSMDVVNVRAQLKKLHSANDG